MFCRCFPKMSMSCGFLAYSPLVHSSKDRAVSSVSWYFVLPSQFWSFVRHLMHCYVGIGSVLRSLPCRSPDKIMLCAYVDFIGLAVHTLVRRTNACQFSSAGKDVQHSKVLLRPRIALNHSAPCSMHPGGAMLRFLKVW